MPNWPPVGIYYLQLIAVLSTDFRDIDLEKDMPRSRVRHRERTALRGENYGADVPPIERNNQEHQRGKAGDPSGILGLPQNRWANGLVIGRFQSGAQQGGLHDLDILVNLLEMDLATGAKEQMSEEGGAVRAGKPTHGVSFQKVFWNVGNRPGVHGRTSSAIQIQDRQDRTS
jgi:hypothetical protein